MGQAATDKPLSFSERGPKANRYYCPLVDMNWKTFIGTITIVWPPTLMVRKECVVPSLFLIVIQCPRDLASALWTGMKMAAAANAIVKAAMRIELSVWM
jgi:hypothetical protein